MPSSSYKVSNPKTSKIFPLQEEEKKEGFIELIEKLIYKIGKFFGGPSYEEAQLRDEERGAKSRKRMEDINKQVLNEFFTSDFSTRILGAMSGVSPEILEQRRQREIARVKAEKEGKKDDSKLPEKSEDQNVKTETIDSVQTKDLGPFTRKVISRRTIQNNNLEI
jgi:hypothetical protein